MADNASRIFACAEASGLPSAIVNSSESGDTLSYDVFMAPYGFGWSFDLLVNGRHFGVASVRADADIIALPYAGEIAGVDWAVLKTETLDNRSQLWRPQRASEPPFALGAIELRYPRDGQCTVSLLTKHGTLTLSDCSSCEPFRSIISKL